MRMNLDHMAGGRFVFGRDFHCEFDYWPLAVSMPPTKICSQCKAAVPVRWCDHVFQSKECNLREKAMKCMRAVESNCVKSARKAKDKLHKACERVSEICDQTLQKQGQNTMCMASMRESRDSDRF